MIAGQTRILFSFLLIFVLQSLSAQEANKSTYDFRIMFYNIENLFDPFDDTLKDDSEYIAGGIKGWNWKKFNKKIDNISKVIIAAGGWQPPEIIAFSEVENRFVLIQLLKRTPLGRFDYKIIHEESPDQRGIDVGLIYLKEKFEEISHRAIRVKSSDTTLRSRDILYVKGLIKDNSGVPDTIHLFINHWPSRTGGPGITAYKRRDAALSVKPVIDSIFRTIPSANIILTGDFNDEPIDESIAKYLDVSLQIGNEPSKLYNLMSPYVGKYDTGTNKYRNLWGVIDQFIVSGELLRNGSKLKVKNNEAKILNFPFLLKEDKTFQGTVPIRTYNGMKYTAGFSDHLPILLTLELSR